MKNESDRLGLIVGAVTVLAVFAGLYLWMNGAGRTPEPQGTGAGRSAAKQAMEAVDRAEEAAKRMAAEEASDGTSAIDIERSFVVCKDGTEYTGKELIETGKNFKLIGGKILFTGEELERLCDPDLGEYDEQADPGYEVVLVSVSEDAEDNGAAEEDADGETDGMENE